MIGVPDPVKGEAIQAFCTLRAGKTVTPSWRVSSSSTSATSWGPSPPRVGCESWTSCPRPGAGRSSAGCSRRRRWARTPATCPRWRSECCKGAPPRRWRFHRAGAGASWFPVPPQELVFRTFFLHRYLLALGLRSGVHPRQRGRLRAGTSGVVEPAGGRPLGPGGMDVRQHLSPDALACRRCAGSTPCTASRSSPLDLVVTS